MPSAIWCGGRQRAWIIGGAGLLLWSPSADLLPANIDKGTRIRCPCRNIKAAAVSGFDRFQTPGATLKMWGLISYLLQWQSSNLSHLYDNRYMWRKILILCFIRGEEREGACVWFGNRQRYGVAMPWCCSRVSGSLHFISPPKSCGNWLCLRICASMRAGVIG